MDQPEQTTPDNSGPEKTSSLPPWKLARKHVQYSGVPDDPGVKSEKKRIPTKWVLITIFLLLVSNTATAGYFLIKRGTNPLSNISSGSSNSVGSQPKSSLSYNPFLPDPGAALGQANDTKRRADLTAISTALNQYMVEYGPEDFPTSMQCIGTSTGCYNLASLLTPEYLQTIPIDSAIGSQINTGYSFYWDEAQGFILEAQGEDGQPITIIR